MDEKMNVEENYKKYDELTKTMNYIKEKYEKITEAPESVQKEYIACSNIRIYLQNGLSGHIHGQTKMEDGIIVDAFHKEKYDIAKANLEEAQGVNDQYIDRKEIELSELPKFNETELTEKFSKVNNAKEVFECSMDSKELAGKCGLSDYYQFSKAIRNNEIETLGRVEKERKEKQSNIPKQPKVENKSVFAKIKENFGKVFENFKKRFENINNKRLTETSQGVEKKEKEVKIDQKDFLNDIKVEVSNKQFNEKDSKDETSKIEENEFENDEVR